MLLYATFYIALAYITSYPLMILAAIISGIGEALVMPALSAYYLDITSEQHRSRVLGIKESSAALGGVLGPLLVVGVSALTTPQGVFMFATGEMVMMFGGGVYPTAETINAFQILKASGNMTQGFAKLYGVKQL